MKVIILYRPKSEHSRQVEEYVRDFLHVEPSRHVKALDVDTREGTAMAELYEATNYPAVLALSNDGQLLKSWLGGFPLMDELAYYARQD